ncbi:MAG TPA: hypothetical protein VME40_11025, partial [Caulobacteraceae bacterium]|nr:hypothetical protein [Caulobacteraceae bacterium]
DVLQALVHLRDAGEPGHAFSRSSSQFVRYAAAEMKQYPPARLDRVLERLTAVVDQAGRPSARNVLNEPS